MVRAVWVPCVAVGGVSYASSIPRTRASSVLARLAVFVKPARPPAFAEAPTSGSVCEEGGGCGVLAV